MKRILITLLFFTATSSIVTGQSLENRIADSFIQKPKIHLVYLNNGTPFDQACGQAMNKPIRQEDINEIFQRLGEFQALWDKEGPTYLKTAINEVGVDFPYKEMQATLTVCDFSSMSSPLIIYVKRFLSSAEKPLPLWAFPELLFHEIMHTYTRSVYDISPLRKKYATEVPVILNHLHSMALEKLVLVKLNKTEILQWLDNRYRNQFGHEYKRAWEIVSDIEGYEAFIKELRAMPKKVDE
ncbi:MAG: hypothetical protein H7122_20225 [Chitinophagaceae bacterium]|nr:hypothetical protein [Chitinophagaceae bacterium]